LTGETLATPCGAAIWTTTAVGSTTALTAASGNAPASATSAATSTHFGELKSNNLIPPTEGGVIDVACIEPANISLLDLFLPQKSSQMAASARLEPIRIRRK